MYLLHDEAADRQYDGDEGILVAVQFFKAKPHGHTRNSIVNSIDASDVVKYYKACSI